MSAQRRFGVRLSALGWLQRLNWNYLEPGELPGLRDLPESLLLANRLLPWLRRFRFDWNGEQRALSPMSIQQIIGYADSCCYCRDWQGSSAIMHRLLLEGVPTRHTLPDGTSMSVKVPLIDWDHVHRNHWDVADAVPCMEARDPDVRELVGYVNGVPLVIVACVERDQEKRWGTTADGIAHLSRGGAPLLARRPALLAQLLLSLDRRGGRYASVGTPEHGWVRWREHGWSGAALTELRDRQTPFAGVGCDPPWAVHAELLAGVLRPDRLLHMLRAFLETGLGGKRYVARPGQFFAVQCALQALKARDGTGGRAGGQLCLAAGSGLHRTRYWLLRALRTAPGCESLRILLPVTRATAEAQPARRTAGPRPGDQLLEFLAGYGGSPLEIPLRTLRGWARKAAFPPAAGTVTGDIILLVDADFWETPPDLLRRLRRCLPQATWLTLCAQPIVLPAADLDPGPPLYHYPPEHAIADGVVVPAWRDGDPIFPDPVREPPADLPDDVPDPRQARVAGSISRHFDGVVRVAERNLRGALLVDTVQEAKDYQRALSADGRLQTHVSGYDNRGLPLERPWECISPQVELVIAHGELPALQDPRLGLLYVDRPLSPAQRLRAVGLINAPHPDKRAALMVDFHASGLSDASSQAWLPSPVVNSRAALAAEHRRLQGLLPADGERDFHACRDHLAPDWMLGPDGEDVDLHRRRRDLLHHRVTAFGQRLQVAIASEAAFTGDQAAVSARYRSMLHRYSVLRDAVSCVALEEDRFNAEDLRVRHWARERAPEVREAPFDYGLLAAAEPAPETDLQQANQAYTRLRHQLGAAGDAAPLGKQSRHALCQILLAPDAQARLQALQAFDAMVQRSLHDGRSLRRLSRGLALLDGLFGTTLNPTGFILVGALIDAVVAEAHLRPSTQFHDHVSACLEPLLYQHLEESQVQPVLNAVLVGAQDWPPD